VLSLVSLLQRVGGEQDMEKPSGLQQDIRPQEPTLKKQRSQQKISQSMPNPKKKRIVRGKTETKKTNKSSRRTTFLEMSFWQAAV